MRISLPRRLWYGNSTLEIDLPESWNVEIGKMKGADAQALSIEQMRKAILNPIGSARLRDLAEGKKTAVIVFDDMTRPTRPYEIAPLIIEELHAGGIRDEDITFVCALGTHGALTQNEFRKKLGPLVESYRVFNHNIYENCVEMGTTSRGTRVMINREVAEADLKIGISCVTAHPQTGFSGGGKLVLPGISHIDSVTNYHLNVAAMEPKSLGMGKFHNNIMRKEISEAAELVGMSFMVNVLFNGRGDAAAVFAGDLEASHASAVEMAIDHYDTEPAPSNKDLAIANTFVKANEMTIGVYSAILALKEFQGTAVVIADSPEGQAIHYLLGRWGRNYGGRQYPVTQVPDSLNLIVLAPHYDKTFGDWFANPERITWTRSWEETLELLERDFGPGSEVAVIPNASMQYRRPKSG